MKQCPTPELNHVWPRHKSMWGLKDKYEHPLLKDSLVIIQII